MSISTGYTLTQFTVNQKARHAWRSLSDHDRAFLRHSQWGIKVWDEGQHDTQTARNLFEADGELLVHASWQSWNRFHGVPERVCGDYLLTINPKTQDFLLTAVSPNITPGVSEITSRIHAIAIIRAVIDWLYGDPAYTPAHISAECL